MKFPLCLLGLLSVLAIGCSRFAPEETIRRGRIRLDDSTSLYYETCGAGTPVLLLHGHSLDRRMWDEQFTAFARAGHQVVRLDFRGYGNSSLPVEGQQFTHMDDLVALMDTLHIGRAHLVGLSMGGFIGADMVAMHPERVRSATLVSGNLRKSPGPSTPMTAEEEIRREREIETLRMRGVERMKQEWFESLMRSGGSQRERMREPLWQMIAEWSAWQPLHKESRVIVGLDALAALRDHGSDVPTLLIEGRSEHNRFNPHPEFMNYLTDCRHVIIDDCGHMLSMERPDEFNRIVLAFISGVDAGLRSCLKFSYNEI